MATENTRSVTQDSVTDDMKDEARQAAEEIRNGRDPKTDPIQVPPPNVAPNQDNVGKVDYLR